MNWKLLIGVVGVLATATTVANAQGDSKVTSNEFPQGHDQWGPGRDRYHDRGHDQWGPGRWIYKHKRADSSPQCRPAIVSKFVGVPVSRLPPPGPNEIRRIACASCSVTLDFNPNRQNFFYDPQTRIIRSASCG